MPLLEKHIIGRLASSLNHLLFPQVCASCGQALVEQENGVCTICYQQLPKTGYHLYTGNPVEKLFWGRLQLWCATSLLFFNKGGGIQRLMHELKYNGRIDLGNIMGNWIGNEVFRKPPFSEANLLLPVPLHPSKLAQRGFNQCDPLVDGISEMTGISSRKRLLQRTVNNPSQTRKGRFSRWENVDRIFRVSKPEEIKGKSVIIIDDVVTTGATLEACAISCMDAGAARVGMATLACA